MSRDTMRASSRWSVVATVLLSVATSTVAADKKSVPTDPRRPAAITTSGVPVLPAKLVEQMRRYQNVRSAFFQGWSPDGQGMLVRTRFANTSQLHRVRVPGGRRQQLTFFDEPATGRFLPGDHRGALVLSMSRGGDENYQVYVLGTHETGQLLRLTDGKSRNVLGPVRSDGLFAIVHSTQRNGRDTDLFIADPHRPGEMTLLLKTTGEYWRATDWSRDGSNLLINHYVSINESYPAVLDVATGKKTPIPIPGTRPASHGTLAFAPDGQWAYITTDTNGEFRQLARVNLKTMAYEFLTEKLPWNVTDVVVEPELGDGRIHDERGRSQWIVPAGRADLPPLRVAAGAGQRAEVFPRRHATRLYAFTPRRSCRRLVDAVARRPVDPMDPQRGGRFGRGLVRGARADPLQDIRRPADSRVRVPTRIGFETGSGTGSGSHSRWSREPIPPAVLVPGPVLPERTRPGGRAAQRPRIGRLRQDLCPAGQRIETRGQRQGHRGVVGLDCDPARPGRLASGRLRAGRTAVTWCWVRLCTSATG